MPYNVLSFLKLKNQYIIGDLLLFFFTNKWSTIYLSVTYLKISSGPYVTEQKLTCQQCKILQCTNRINLLEAYLHEDGEEDDELRLVLDKPRGSDRDMIWRFDQDSHTLVNKLGHVAKIRNNSTRSGTEVCLEF